MALPRGQPRPPATAPTAAPGATSAGVLTPPTAVAPMAGATSARPRRRPPVDPPGGNGSSSGNEVPLCKKTIARKEQNTRSVDRRKRRKTSASEQSGEDSCSACESLKSDDVQITRGRDYVLPLRSKLSGAEEKRVVALIKEIKAKVTVFVAKMLRSSVQYVTIPKEYANVHFPYKESTTITLRSPPANNKTWHPKFYQDKTMSKLTGKWANFVTDIRLREGDICVFVPAKSGKSVTLMVHLLRKETTDSQTEVSHESSECEGYILPYGVRLTTPQSSAVKKIMHSIIQSEVPICVSIMTDSNVGPTRPKLELSNRFAAKHLPKRDATLIFQCEGKIWNIKMTFRDKRWYLIGGWPKFRSDNSLRVGDFCLFELKKDKKKFTVIVHLLRKESIGDSSSGSPVLDSNNVRQAQ